MKAESDIKRIIILHGADIISSSHMQSAKQHIHHGSISVFEHSAGVACLCVCIAKRLHLQVDEKALVRGALLHDYFLYDWHVPDPLHRLHGFTHAKRALDNASRDFLIGSIERDMIAKHMFPLNIKPPRYRESIIVCLADKFCAVCETLSIPYFRSEIEEISTQQHPFSQ